MTISFTIPVMVFMVNLITITYVFAQNWKGPVNRAYIYFLLSANVWVALDMVEFINFPGNAPSWFDKLTSVFWIPIGFLFLNFIYHWLQKEKDLIYRIFFSSAIVSILISLGSQMIINYGVLYVPISMLVIILPIIYGAVLLYQDFKRSQKDSLLRRQLSLMVLGVVISLGLGLIIGISLPVVFKVQEWYFLTSSLTGLQALFVLPALVKFNFLATPIQEVTGELFEHSPQAVLIISPSENVIHTNNSAVDLFGIDKKTILGMDTSELFLDYDSNKNYKNFETQTKGGEKKIVSIFNTVIRQGGLLLGKMIIIDDISERKQSEEKLNYSRMQLRRLTKYLQNIQEEERAFISREIHDVLGQELTSMKLDLSWLGKTLTNINPDVGNQIDSLKEQIDKTIQSVREISSKLHPAILEDLGLRAAVEWQVKEFEERSKINCKLHIPNETLELNKEDTRSIFRIIQESLTNIMRHAAAKEVEISIIKTPENIQMTISDDGKGFSQDKNKGGHSFGLLGMQERAYSMDATIDITSKKKAGTTIHLKIPRKAEVI